jgi:hypothetical protein
MPDLRGHCELEALQVLYPDADSTVLFSPAS